MPTLTINQTLTGQDLGLTSGLSDILVLNIGGRRVLYALSRSEGQLLEVEVATNGSLSVVNTLALNGSFEAGSTPLLAPFVASSGNTGLMISGLGEASGQSVSLGVNGALGSQSSLVGIGTLDAPLSVGFGGVNALISGQATGGLVLVSDSGSGYAPVATLDDDSTRYIADVSGSVTFGIGSTTYVATTSALEDGVNLAEITGSTITHWDALGILDGLPINTPGQVAVVQRMGETQLVIGSFDTSSLSTVRVDASGELSVSDHILDGVGTYFQTASAIDTLVYGDFAFVAAGGAESGVSLFAVLPGGRLVLLDSVSSDAASPLYRVSAIDLVVSGNRLDAFVSSSWNPGITRLSYDLSDLGSVLVAQQTGGTLSGTSGDDQIIGSALNDTLLGGSGDDILLDGAGSDVLTGGGGADLFVMHPDEQSDTITDYDRVADSLDLSAFDFLYDVGQLTITPTSNGAILAYAGETIQIVAVDGAPLTAADFTNAKILNVDRPPLVPFSQTLVGGQGNDTLNGAGGDDVILGSAGDDLLIGQEGDDSLEGGAGADFLEGNIGNDTLLGQSDPDTLVGGLGDDLLIGGPGDDVIYGDAWMG